LGHIKREPEERKTQKRARQEDSRKKGGSTRLMGPSSLLEKRNICEGRAEKKSHRREKEKKKKKDPTRKKGSKESEDLRQDYASARAQQSKRGHNQKSKGEEERNLAKIRGQKRDGPARHASAQRES